jgi:hypothetical protein
MTYYGMSPGEAHGAGRAVYGLDGQARSVASGLLSSISAGAGQCDHPLMAAALEAFHEAHSGSAHNLARQVQDLGADTGGSANAIVAGDNDSAAMITTAVQPSQDLNDRLSGRPLSAG